MANDASPAATTPDNPPPPPVPASDPGLGTSTASAACDDPSDAPSPRLASLSDDIFDVTPLAALQLLGAGVEALVRITGDIPPTPPLPPESSAHGGGQAAAPLSVHTHMRGMQAEKESIVRSLSANSLQRLRAQAGAAGAEGRAGRAGAETGTAGSVAADASPFHADVQDTDASVPVPAPLPSRSRLPPTPPPTRPLESEIDGVRLRALSPNRGSLAPAPTQLPPFATGPEGGQPPLAAAPPYIVIGAESQPLNLQHAAITRKFYSKKAPPIGIAEYLLRLHRFCPMSTGVYLATSLYIHRLAVAERAIAVTRRNVHRLLLAGLRVAMKALEDLSYPHAKLARVGGVSEAELARLEINFCFLTGFELAICAEDMRRHWVLMKSGKAVGQLDQDATAAVAAAMETRRPTAVRS